MSGFLDRLASRAVGQAPLVHPRVRSHFEPDIGMLPGGGMEVAPRPVEEIAEVKEVAAVPRMKGRGPVAEARTFEPEPQSLPAERGMVQPAGAKSSPPNPLSRPHSRPAREEVLADSEEKERRLRRDPHPLTPSPTRTHTLPGEGEPGQANQPAPVSFRAVASPRPGATPAPVLARVVAPPLPGDVSAAGRGGRGVRVHEGWRSAEPAQATERSAPPPALPTERRLFPTSPASVEPQQPLPLRPRSARAEELPTVEPDRHAALPPSLEASEPSETVVQVSIGRIDVRAAQPAAPERRPARPSGPRLTLTDYLKRREERRR